MRKALFLTSICLLVLSCSKPFVPVSYEGDLIIDSEDDQALLQEFFDNGYNSLIGNLSIYYVGGLNLELLENLVDVDGLIYVFSEEVTDLGFLSNLRTVKGQLVISSTQITNIDDLAKLSSVDGLFSIYNNSLLSEVKGFKNLTEVGYLAISNNKAVSCIDGFNNLESCIEIHLNGESLESIGGFNSIKKVTDINISGFTSPLLLKGFSALDSLNVFSIMSSSTFSFEGTCRLKYCEILSLLMVDNIVELKPFTGCSVVWLDVNMCDSVQNLDFLSGIADNRYVNLATNPVLNDFCGLQTEGLETCEIRGNKYNPSMQDLLDGMCRETR